MSRGRSQYQREIMQVLDKVGAINIIDVCATLNYFRARRINPSIQPNNPFLAPVPYAIGDFRPQAAYRMMKSLEDRGLVARLLHRRPAIWYCIDWKDGKPKMRPDSLRDWFDYNTVIERDGRIQVRTRGRVWE
jgi:hypothetical protein